MEQMTANPMVLADLGPAQTSRLLARMALVS
jgi:hypothetical protein